MIPFCASCVRLLPAVWEKGEPVLQPCEAFPDGIPEEIYSGEKAHDEPIEGDNGLRYLSIWEGGDS